MKPFSGTPWLPPTVKMRTIHQNLRSWDNPRDKPSQNKKPEWFERYRKMMSLGGLESVNQDASSAPNRNAGNFIQTEINPGVAYDKTTKKFCILLFENGIPKPRGSFVIESEGRAGFSGFYDLLSRGPHGIAGVEASARNPGPPGVALLPEGHWQKNKGTRGGRPTTALLKDKGYFMGGPIEHDRVSERPYLPESSIRGMVGVISRPSTAAAQNAKAWAGPQSTQSTMVSEASEAASKGTH